MKIMSVVGARPNFMKIAPLCRELAKHPEVEHILVHTGQHYDYRMSESFFSDLGIPAPDVHLNIGSGTHAEQVGRTMIEFEKVVRAGKPDWIVVVGDVNATCACSLVAKKDRKACRVYEDRGRGNACGGRCPVGADEHRGDADGADSRGSSRGV